MSFKPGDISLIRFPRADLQRGKYRPVLLLSKMPGPKCATRAEPPGVIRVRGRTQGESAEGGVR